MLQIKEVVTNSYISLSKLPGFDYVINPYVGCPHKCIYCYAEFMKRFSSHEEDWGTFVDVKIRSTATKQVDLRGKNVFVSSVTDAYNPLEEKYRLTRRLLEQLRPCGAKLTVLTKSPLITRDIDIFKGFEHIRIAVSLTTTDETFRQQIEPFGGSVQQRLNVLKTMKENGLPTTVFMSPIFPYLSDFKAVVDAARPYADEFWFENLKLRGAGLPRVLSYIHQFHPHLRDFYEDAYRNRNWAYWKELKPQIEDYCSQLGLTHHIYFSDKEPKKPRAAQE